MNRSQGAAALATLLVALAGCSSSSPISHGHGPARSSPPSTGERPSPGPVPGAAVHLISVTGGGSRRTPYAFPLNSEPQLEAFLRQFPSPAMRGQIRQAVQARLGPDHNVVGATIAIGCDQPSGADVSADGNGRIRIVPRKAAVHHPECFAEVTTVAVAVVPHH